MIVAECGYHYSCSTEIGMAGDDLSRDQWLTFFGKFPLQLQFDYGNAAALHSLSVPAGIITITMVIVTIITTLL